ncbi:MAG: VOC family protein [Chloroflexota bacterium]
MRPWVMSLFVDDQSKALRFYTEVLGFRLHTEVPLGEHRWLTVAAGAGPDAFQVGLEPNAHPAARAFQAALMADGIPVTSFAVDDIAAETARLKRLGVRFSQDPLEMGGVTTAVFDDTCGNLLQLIQLP